ncbi:MULTISPECIES: DUF2357 domain-containing protein [Bacillus]|uniref:DUF2357 domain-containing protein n=1 Tax=Bacillus TaxID=1386 RepID=UPI000BF57922|nr:DUF2357 domain-containing protein [Bacillus toyonensis]PGA39575.1 hypothetical protein COL81_13840 [Bacillus toyonensis]PGC02617.1 hypothetical protein COM20_23570 [Bacillus toyonensis]
MGIPFSVHFRESGYKLKELTSFVTNKTDLDEINEKNILEITENVDMELCFDCDDFNARFYMDGLDILSVRLLDVDEGENVYFPPSPEYVTIYKNVDGTYPALQRQSAPNRIEYYPLIPGYYRIKIMYQNQAYYSLVKVVPKQITEEQWEVMKKEVQDTLEGLAQDLIRKNVSIDKDDSDVIPVDMLRKIYVLKSEYQKLINSILAIREQPRLKISKKYSLVPVGKNSFVDAQSIRYRAKHPESMNEIYTPNYYENHNIIENQWIVYIMNFIVKEMKSAARFIDKYIMKLKNELKEEKRFIHEYNQIRVETKEKSLEELRGYIKFITKIRIECKALLLEEWAKPISTKKPMRIPHVLNLDVRYKRIFKVYRMLNDKEFSIKQDSKYDFYWKRTDKLYEIWGFIKFMKVLQSESLGFKVVSGWIYDEKYKEKNINIPFLESSTAIVYMKDDIKLHLVYDEEIPNKGTKTTREKPLYVSGSKHNRPDTRIDVYKKNEYIGSLIVDFKYRPRKNVWKSASISYQNKTTMQLISYRQNIQSNYIFENSKSKDFRHRINPVQEVWAVYPNHITNDGHNIDPFEQHKIRLFGLSPNEETTELEELLENTLQKIIKGDTEVQEGIII